MQQKYLQIQKKDEDGNIKNNYLKFSNEIWRIVRINGDGSIKIILNDKIPVTLSKRELLKMVIQKKLNQKKELISERSCFINLEGEKSTDNKKYSFNIFKKLSVNKLHNCKLSTINLVLFKCI